MKNSVFIFLLIISKLSTSQNATVAYSRDFEFKEGIYLTIDQFKQNNPIPISDIVSAVPKTEHNFLTQVLDQKTVTFKDETGQEQKLATASIWGYCRNRSVFLNFNQTFNRLNVIGSLCHFTSEVVVVSYQDPTYYGRGINNSYRELKQFILNTESNSVNDFTVPAMEQALKSEPQLLNDFQKLRKKEKSNSIFIYLRKFNEKRPLYLGGR
ncbi:MAG TPA: hypothetical protein PK289_02175 [Bacteroidia bacterium]|jgi:hypothetical protein|nr:hypothetical protein [Bacteroidia bacterium]HRG53115.1 hypothetical protein [Bacteroidia bacterium]